MSIVTGIETKTILPFFATEKEIVKVDGKIWENHVYPTKPIPHVKGFYYSHVRNKEIFPLPKS